MFLRNGFVTKCFRGQQCNMNVIVPTNSMTCECDFYTTVQEVNNEQTNSLNKILQLVSVFLQCHSFQTNPKLNGPASNIPVD